MAADREEPLVDSGEDIPEPVPVVHAAENLDEGEESDEYDIEVRSTLTFFYTGPKLIELLPAGGSRTKKRRKRGASRKMMTRMKKKRTKFVSPFFMHLMIVSCCVLCRDTT